MYITVTNFLGLLQGKIPLPDSPVAVLGPNASGKTSFAMAMGALLSRTHNPLGLHNSKHYLHEGSDYGEVALKSDTGVEYARWVLSEDAIRVFAEAPAAIHVHATSLTNFVTRKPADRVTLWEDVFLPASDKLTGLVTTEIKEKIGQHGLIEEVLNHLRLSDWKGTEEIYKSLAREEKKKWQQVTGQSWGSKKGVTWVPTNWRSDFTGVTVMEANTNLEQARESLRNAQTRDAVTESQLLEANEALTEAVDFESKLAQIQEVLSEVNQKVAVAREPYDKLIAEGKAVRKQYNEHVRAKPQAEKTTPCPYCGKPIIVGFDKSLISATNEAAMKSKMQAWEHGEKKLSAQLTALRETVARMCEETVGPLEHQKSMLEQEESNLTNSAQYARKRATSANSKVMTEEDQNQVAIIEQQVKDADEFLKAVTDKNKADASHNSILDYQLIAYTLGPQGIRGQSMKEGLATLHDNLHLVSLKSGWATVSLDKSYAVLYGNRPAALCSESEKWVTQFSLRAALAMSVGDKRVIADGADILDASHRGRLIVLLGMLKKEQVYPIICATSSIWESGEDRTDPVFSDAWPAEWPVVTLNMGKT